MHVCACVHAAMGPDNYSFYFYPILLILDYTDYYNYHKKSDYSQQIDIILIYVSIKTQHMHN